MRHRLGHVLPDIGTKAVALDADMQRLLEMQMLRFPRINEFLDVLALLGGSLAHDSDARLRLEGDLLQILALVAQDLADEVEAGESLDGHVDLVHELDAALLVQFDVLLVRGRSLHDGFLSQLADFVVDDRVDVRSCLWIDRF